ncbi:hypothetical protein Efla_002335 [Eimeria flavescens]
MMYEWGGVGGSRNINLSGGQRSSTAVGRRAFLQQTRGLREQRERQRQQQQAQLRIAAAWRACRERRRQKQRAREEFDQLHQLLLQQQQQQPQQQQQQQQQYRQQARRVAFFFNYFDGADTADGQRLLAAAAAVPPPAAAAAAGDPAAAAAEEGPTCALHLALLRALSLHYRNVLLLEHHAAARQRQQHRQQLQQQQQQGQQQREPSLLLIEGDIRCCSGWRGSALSPAAKLRFGQPAAARSPSAAAAAGAAAQTATQAAAAAAAAAAASSSVHGFGRLPLALLPPGDTSAAGRTAAACAAATARLLLQLLDFDRQQQQQQQQGEQQQRLLGLFESALHRLLGIGACVAAQVGDFVSRAVLAAAAARAAAVQPPEAAAAATPATPAAAAEQHELSSDANAALLLLQHVLAHGAFRADALAQAELLVHLLGQPLLLPSFAAEGEGQQQDLQQLLQQKLRLQVLLRDEALAQLETMLLAATDPTTATAAAAAGQEPAAAGSAAFQQLSSASAVVAAANAAATLRRRAAFPRRQQQQQQQQQQQASIGLQQKQQQRPTLRQQQLQFAAASVEQLDDLQQSLRRPYTLKARNAAAATATATAAATAAEPQMGLGVCLAGNVLSLLCLRWHRLSAALAATTAAAAAGTAAAAAFSCPLWVLALLRLCGWACPFDLLRTSLLSAEEQQGLPQQQQQQQQPLPLFAAAADDTLRRQLVVLTEGWAVDAFFAAAQENSRRGLADLLQLYFPPDVESAAEEAATAEAAAAAAAAAAGDGAALIGEATDESDSDSADEANAREFDRNFRGPWDHKYTANERLILNALSVSTPLPLRLLHAVRSMMEVECGGCIDTLFCLMGQPPEWNSEWGDAVRALCIVLKYKLQMTDDSELLEETEDDGLSSSSSKNSSSSGTNSSSSSRMNSSGSRTDSSSHFSLKRSDLRWLLLTLNRLAWLLLRAAYAPAAPQQQQQQQQQQNALLLPSGAAGGSAASGGSSSKRGSRKRRGRERLWQLVPGVLRELLDLSDRVSLVSHDELVLPDGPSSLIVSAAAGQRLPALWECLVWCMRGGDAAAAAAAGGSSSSGSPPAAGATAAATAAAGRGFAEVAPCVRLSNFPTRLLASSLVYLPHTIAFNDRLAVFYQLLAYEHGDSSAYYLNRRCFKIRRTHIGLSGCLPAFLSVDIMRGFQVEFITAEGTPEAGIDGGGLLKELIVELSRRAFDPAYGLFSSCDDNSLFPNPSVEFLHPNFSQLFLAIGKLVGKAVSEGVLIEPQLNRVFLKLLLRRPCRLDDLKSLDPSVHRSLMLLKHYPGDAADLSLTFSVMRSDLGDKEEVDLIPNGRNIPVTNSSKLRYVQLMSDFKCVRQIERQTSWFLQGFGQALPLHWLQMFAVEELQHLISGTTQGFDVNDLRQHASYSGGYTVSSPQVVWLWELLADMADAERSSFLMFVTSCSRAPLRGFGCLSPPFTVHRVPDISRLPTSSTCVNLLKLPAYATKEELRYKVRDAIGGTSGFGLS